jgi:hypothetical protein
MDDVEKSLPLPGLELRSLGRPARSQSLYPLSYPVLGRHVGYFLTLSVSAVVLPRYYPGIFSGGTEESHEESRQVSNRASLEYKQF